MPPEKPTKKAHEIVADQLRDRIVSGELVEGDLLAPEEELTHQFGVARTTLREALRVLESQGLLAIRRGRSGGPVVTHPSLDPVATALAVTLQLQSTTIGDLDTARRIIEPQIAGQLALEHTDDDIDALEVAIRTAHQAAEENDPESFGIAAALVHETLVERSGNRTIKTLSLLLQTMVNDFYARSASMTSQRLMRRAVRSYRKLVTLIIEGDHDAAVAHWQEQMSFTIGNQDQSAPLTLLNRD